MESQGQRNKFKYSLHLIFRFFSLNLHNLSIIFLANNAGK
ncbi:hypothetical protein CKO_02840 [Citrobacter koseri ATCC BAA-895]|uniref:Uncharacterized protein n=1 Tax=Citrobacter koseri (strain ATCC BAA-895 / CDC 4225-83 / SGSC4696) TaxID=290338 RepID=A8AKD3_CITK8|nr:hypothetical protein CKO_02840 [Citrobacter koseri ATCC BAA-895]